MTRSYHCLSKRQENPTAQKRNCQLLCGLVVRAWTALNQISKMLDKTIITYSKSKVHEPKLWCTIKNS